MVVLRQIRPPEGALVQCYGGGVNTAACLVLMARLGLTPRAIVMADPGSERSGTKHWRDVILPPWLASRGFPQVEVVSRLTEGPFNSRVRAELETLRDECSRSGTIPSVAYGKKKCSAKHKGDPQRWWAARQPWTNEEWRAGRKLVKVVGYDLDEQRRADKAAIAIAPPPAGAINPLTGKPPRDYGKWERERFTFWYPLIEAKLGREECEELIESEGLPLPPKSACTFCPNNTLEEWRELRETEPEAFADAVTMSRRAEATITNPVDVGLMRCNPAGKRQLHVWADGGYPDARARQLDLDMPCESECGT